MKRILFPLLAFSVLLLTAGCKKDLKSSVDLSKGAKAYSSSWHATTPTSQIIRFDLDDGHGSSCLLYYDLSEDVVKLTQFVGANITDLWLTEGFQLDDGQSINIGQFYDYVIDPYNATGGLNAIPFDANGTGHEDHVLLYAPGQGIAYLLKYVGGGVWHLDWPSSLQYTGGIGGYDLMNVGDKVISYDYGSGAKNALICYRPGFGNIWVITNTGSGDAPVWNAVVRGSGGIGGFDLKGVTDQVVAEDNSPGVMDLVCYRPGYGYVWYLHHNQYSTTFSAQYTTRNGFFNFSFLDFQDRMIATNLSGSTASTANNDMLCYRPGAGIASLVVDHMYGNTVNGGTPQGLYYPMTINPYIPNTTYTDIGDHVLNFNANGLGNSSLVFYSNGGGNPSEVYELNPNTNSYIQIY
ncbi:hypothetical protein [Dinghuibacter silviterrae]|uniref:Uncharacterized protein n=1 Tax=Dinghuibacter silviterrae TaxID=1539049 RepID=A0A4R8DG02_9BACT|nr:hypothetical protein [Dinghuibacter silviterrae]TDW96543.1 hypothetical protein EDB95_4374 [Dinghuibacter silviterrae]